MADNDDMFPEFPADLKIENIEVKNPPETGIIQSYGSIEPPPDFVRPDDEEEIEDDEDPDDEDAFSNNSSDDDSDDSDEKNASEDIEMEEAKTTPQDDQEARLNLLAQVQQELEVLVLIKRQGAAHSSAVIQPSSTPPIPRLPEKALSPTGW